MNKTYLIYYHRSPENKYYIGQTCQEVNSRWKNGYGYKTEKFSSAIKKLTYYKPIHTKNKHSFIYLLLTFFHKDKVKSG